MRKVDRLILKKLDMIQNDLSDFKEEVRSEIKAIKAEIVEMKANIVELKERVTRLEEKLDDYIVETNGNLLRIDNRRSSYYSYHTGHNWGDLYNYDMTFRSDVLGIEETVRLMGNMILTKEKQLKENIKVNLDKKEELIINSSMLVRDLI